MALAQLLGFSRNLIVKYADNLNFNYENYGPIDAHQIRWPSSGY